MSRVSLPLFSNRTDGRSPTRLTPYMTGIAADNPRHRAVVRTALTLGSFALARCVAPQCREVFSSSIERAQRWTHGETPVREVQSARSEAFGAVPWAESETVSAVMSATRSESVAADALVSHAQQVTERYVRLAVHYTLQGVLLAVDTVAQPEQAALVPTQLAGGLAYQRTGLGAARNAQLRARALEQAQWESQRSDTGHDASALALQTFHEYLGAAWKDSSDAYRAYFEDFFEWAMGG